MSLARARDFECCGEIPRCASCPYDWFAQSGATGEELLDARNGVRLFGPHIRELVSSRRVVLGLDISEHGISRIIEQGLYPKSGLKKPGQKDLHTGTYKPAVIAAEIILKRAK